MTQEVLYSLKAPYRDDLKVTGFRFGSGSKSACIVGAIRGNEVQQLYVCARLVKALKELERKGAIVPDNEILVIPSVNAYSMNTGKRFWAVDNTDINRMFPGYDRGETTQRIAAGVFEAVKGYSYGIHFASFYMPGDFIPHVRMMETGFQTTSLANLFGLPYVVVRHPRPIDTTTLNYNWQVWETNAFSVYTSATDQIDEPSARSAVDAVLRFLTRVGVLRGRYHNGYIATVVDEQADLQNVVAPTGGIWRPKCGPGGEVSRGDIVGEILDPLTCERKVRVTATADGVLFFAYRQPLVMEHTVLFKIVKHLHG